MGTTQAAVCSTSAASESTTAAVGNTTATYWSTSAAVGKTIFMYYNFLLDRLFFFNYQRLGMAHFSHMVAQFSPEKGQLGQLKKCQKNIVSQFSAEQWL